MSKTVFRISVSSWIRCSLVTDPAILNSGPSLNVEDLCKVNLPMFKHFLKTTLIVNQFSTYISEKKILRTKILNNHLLRTLMHTVMVYTSSIHSRHAFSNDLNLADFLWSIEYIISSKSYHGFSGRAWIWLHAEPTTKYWDFGCHRGYHRVRGHLLNPP